MPRSAADSPRRSAWAKAKAAKVKARAKRTRRQVLRRLHGQIRITRMDDRGVFDPICSSPATKRENFDEAAKLHEHADCGSDKSSAVASNSCANRTPRPQHSPCARAFC